MNSKQAIEVKLFPGQLEPGRELDALVAEKVMGWKRGDWLKEWPDGSKQEYFDVWIAPESAPRHTTPAFSTDISAAWQVVKEMRKDGWYFSLNGVAYFRRKGGSGKGHGKQGDECGDAHAICLAALEAVESAEVSASQG